MREMVHFIPPAQRRLAMSAVQADHLPVLIVGESGSGKGGLARWIHRQGPRSTKPYVIADPRRPLQEQIVEAHGGTIEIPEIGLWSEGERDLLLHYLSHHSLPHPTHRALRLLVHARVIATTSQALEAKAKSLMFSPELLGKLEAIRIEMPSLATRMGEFEDIALTLLHEIASDHRKDHLKGMDKSAWEKLKTYDWPGNLRELRNVLRVGVIAAQGDRIEANDLPQFGPENPDFKASRDEFERVYLTELLKSFNHRIDETCRMTRLSPEELMAKIQKLGIQLPTAN